MEGTKEEVLKSKSGIESIPNEILIKVLLHLSVYGELQKTMGVCHRWLQVAKEVLKLRKTAFIQSVNTKSLHCNTSICPFINLPMVDGQATCIHGKYLYIFGGFSKSYSTFNTLWRMDLATKEIQKMTTKGSMMPSPRGRAALVSYNNLLFLIGGITLGSFFNNVPKTLSVKDNYYLDLNLMMWTRIADSPLVVEDCTAYKDTYCKVGKYFCVITDCLRQSSEAPQKIRFIDLSNPKAFEETSLPSKMPNPRRQSKMVAFDDSHLLLFTGAPITDWTSIKDKMEIWLLTIKDDIVENHDWTWTKLDPNNKEAGPEEVILGVSKVDDCIVVITKQIPPSSLISIRFPQATHGNRRALRAPHQKHKETKPEEKCRCPSSGTRNFKCASKRNNEIFFNHMVVYVLDTSEITKSGNEVSWVESSKDVRSRTILSPKDGGFDCSILTGENEIIVLGIKFDGATSERCCMFHLW